MKSYIDLKDIDDAMKNAHQIRSEAFLKVLKDTHIFMSELFTSYNPQIIFRR